MIQQEYDMKAEFVEKYPLFVDWPVKWKKTLVTAMMKQEVPYEDALFRQGENADRMYFLIR